MKQKGGAIMTLTRKHVQAGLLSLSLLALFALPMMVGAQGAIDPGLDPVKASGLPDKDIRLVIASMIRTAMGLLGIIAVLIVLYGGFTWMTAAGSEEKVGKAKKILTSGIIGLVIVISAYAITSFVVNGLIAATSG